MEKRSQAKLAMAYGAMYGLAAAIISLIFYFSGFDMQSKAPTLVSYLVLIITIVMGVKSYRDQDLGGYISYGKSLGTGVLIGLFGGVVAGVYVVLFFTVIDPTMLQVILDKSQEQMADKGMSEDQIETAMKWTAKMMTPPFLFVFSVLGTAFMAFVFSLIISIFLKREQNPFQQAV